MVEEKNGEAERLPRERTSFEKAFQHFEVQKAFYIFNEISRQFAAVFVAKTESEVKT